MRYSRITSSLFALGLFALCGDALAQIAPETEASEVTAPDPTQSPPAAETPEATQPVSPLEAEAQVDEPVSHVEQPTSPQEMLSAGEQAELEAEFEFEEDISELGGARIGTQVHGFTDVLYRHFYLDKDEPMRRLIQNRPEFLVGNLNVYFDTHIGERFRSLIEVRFLFNPNGDIVIDPMTFQGERTVTASQDSVDGGNRSLYWGGIEIERVQLDYRWREELNLRAGMWLSPYGIWNEDHAGLVYLPVNRPYVVGDGFIPERQMGLQLFGSTYSHGARVGYHLTASNGRMGAVPQNIDFNGELSFGGRLFVETSAFGELKVGVSGFGGRFTDRGQDPYLNEDGFGMRRPVIEEYDELSASVDISWDIAGLVLRGEWIYNERAFTKRGRPAVGQGAPGLHPDASRSGGYLVLAYRLPWLNITPYGMLDYRNPFKTPNGGDNGDARGLNWGLNVRVLPELALKLQYTYMFWPNAEDGIAQSGTLRVSQAQVVWAF